MNRTKKNILNTIILKETLYENLWFYEYLCNIFIYSNKWKEKMPLINQCRYKLFSEKCALHKKTTYKALQPYLFVR